MTAQPEMKLPTGQIINWNTQNLASVYANIMAISMTAFDLSIMFGEIGYATPESVEAVGRVKIILSPEQASNLIKLLSVAVEKYAATNGDLRTSASVDVEAFSKTLTENMVVART
jgi:hypothetical protein